MYSEEEEEEEECVCLLTGNREATCSVSAGRPKEQQVRLVGKAPLREAEGKKLRTVSDWFWSVCAEVSQR